MSPTIKQLVDLYRSRQHADLLVSAHRGYRWSGVPENSRESIIRAAQAGMTSVEVDLRVTLDGVVVCIHDTRLGRTTTVAEDIGRTDVYDPLTGKGYSPLVAETGWHGCLERAHLKDEMGKICHERVMTLADLVDTIVENDLHILVFMDIKTRAGVEACYHQLKDRRDAKGRSVLEWCIFKPEAVWHSTPAVLEREAWYQDALERHLQPLWIPVFDNTAWVSKEDNVVDMLKAWASRRYTISIEIGLRGPGGWLQDAVSWMSSPAGPTIGMGFFAALGDVRDTPDGLTIPFGKGQDPGRRKAYDDNVPPQDYENFLLPGQTVDGIDCRADMVLYRDMGFSWVIADPAPEITDIWRKQRNLVQNFIEEGRREQKIAGRSDKIHPDLIAKAAPVTA